MLEYDKDLFLEHAIYMHACIYILYAFCAHTPASDRIINGSINKVFIFIKRHF